eukprot:1159950-Pelagomonas_calceolata.AAC.6
MQHGIDEKTDSTCWMQLDIGSIVHASMQHDIDEATGDTCWIIRHAGCSSTLIRPLMTRAG